MSRSTTTTVAAIALALSLAVPGTILTTIALTETRLAVDLEPGEAAVLAGSPGDEPRILVRAGHHRILAPLVQAQVVDLRPRRIVFGADANDDEASSDRREALRVRARNGSVLQMQELEVHWRVDPDNITQALADGGAGDPHQPGRVAALAAGAMRDAYGVLESEEVADALRARDALELARADLARHLQRHGLELIQVTAPKPRFDREYETAIEQRKLFEQEAERLATERQGFSAQRGALFEKTRAKLELAAAQQEEALAVLEGQQDETVAQILDEAQRRSTALGLQAASRTTELATLAANTLAEGQAQAESLASTVDAFAEHGDLAVREALVERLAMVRFEIAPRRGEEDAR
ncbi:SPFH domain-containing protein [Engelhardtia mirabilis]|uniref:SPFH domain / Band 7 family protein n=1 Tax=Engelhardtia mirabilis TaxID=2528011 RepID=A0A518BI78_9BACT|nr:SPFH domain / Band 7 family protein [Planctomycetes bacterium Pla133]QDV00969.1 SPFH domain / Band 7 family protein [Planctomycetes bacterium Pla86]